jgi:hypothetical protein
MGKSSVIISGSLIICFGLSVFLTSGCNDKDNTVKFRIPSSYSKAGSVSIDRDTRTNSESYGIAVAGMAKSYSEGADEIYKGMSDISNEYTRNINTVDFTQDGMDSYTNSLAAALDKYASAVLYGYDAAYFLVNGITDNKISSLFLRRDLSPTAWLAGNSCDHSADTVNYDNNFGYIGFAAYSSFESLIKAVDDRISNGTFIISNSVEGSEEHRKINEKLAIASDSAKNQTMEAFNSLNIKAKLVKVRQLEAINREYAEASAIQQSVETIRKSCTELVNSMKSSSPGTVYDTQNADDDKVKLEYLLKITGQDSGNVAASYMGLSANSISGSTATISESVAVVISGKAQSDLHIKKPSSGIGTEEAKTILMNMAAYDYSDIKDTGKIRDALYAYTLNEAGELYSKGITSTEGDGSVHISIPEKNCIKFLSKPNNNTSFRTPDYGVTETMIAMKGYIPEAYYNLDLLPSGFSIGVEYLPATKLTQKIADIPSESNISITTLINPGNIDSKPEEDRNFLVFANPLVPGIEISYKSQGGEGWDYNAGKPLTNGGGYVEFFMPASPDDTEDSMTINSGSEIKKVFKFKL